MYHCDMCGLIQNVCMPRPPTHGQEEDTDTVSTPQHTRPNYLRFVTYVCNHCEYFPCTVLQGQHSRVFRSFTNLTREKREKSHWGKILEPPHDLLKILCSRMDIFLPGLTH